MVLDRPKFRRDLEARPVQLGTSRYIELRDPNRGHTLRFSSDGYSIAFLLDGVRDLGEVRRAIQSELGVAIDPVKLEALVRQLDKLGCLEHNLSSLGEETSAYEAIETVMYSPEETQLARDIEEMVTMAVEPEELEKHLAETRLGVRAEESSNEVATRPRTSDGTAVLRKKKAVMALKGRADKAESRRTAVESPADRKAFADRKASAKRASSPPPIPPASKPPKKRKVEASAKVLEPATGRLGSQPEREELPSLPPLPEWPPPGAKVRSPTSMAPRDLPRPRTSPPAGPAYPPPPADRVSRPNTPMAEDPRSATTGLPAGSQLLWLAIGFFAVAALWAFWSVFRLF